MKQLFLCIAFFAGPAAAESWGVRFDQMPVGCRIHREKSTGAHEITQYMGFDGSSHIMETYAGPAGTMFLRKTTYSPDGVMIRLDGPEGQWETYSPDICILAPGRCVYVVRTNTGAEHTLQADSVQDGNQFTIEFRRVGDMQFRTLEVTVGRFNLPQMYRDGDFAIAITHFEDCSLSS